MLFSSTDDPCHGRQGNEKRRCSMRREGADFYRRWSARLRKVYPIDVAWRAVHDFGRQGGPTSAAAISYYVLFSLIPLLTVVVAVVGVIVRDPAVEDEVVQIIVGEFPDELNIESYVQTAVDRVARLNYGVVGPVALVGVFWSASGMFGALRRALNRAFDVQEARTYLRAKAIDLLGVIGVMALVLLTLVATTTLSLLRARLGTPVDGVLANVGWEVLTVAVSLGLSFLTYLLMYRVVPDITASVGDLWLGAALAALGVEVVKTLYSFYATTFAHYDEVFGALAGAAALLFFVFVVSSILIFAAEVSGTLIGDRAARSPDRMPPPPP
jgi:membrane protein